MEVEKMSEVNLKLIDKWKSMNNLNDLTAELRMHRKGLAGDDLVFMLSRDIWGILQGKYKNKIPEYLYEELAEYIINISPNNTARIFEVFLSERGENNCDTNPKFNLFNQIIFEQLLRSLDAGEIPEFQKYSFRNDAGFRLGNMIDFDFYAKKESINSSVINNISQIICKFSDKYNFIRREFIDFVINNLNKIENSGEAIEILFCDIRFCLQLSDWEIIFLISNIEDSAIWILDDKYSCVLKDRTLYNAAFFVNKDIIKKHINNENKSSNAKLMLEELHANGYSLGTKKTERLILSQVKEREFELERTLETSEAKYKFYEKLRKSICESFQEIVN